MRATDARARSRMTGDTVEPPSILRPRRLTSLAGGDMLTPTRRTTMQLGSNRRTAAALAFVFALGTASTAGAQVPAAGQGRAGGPGAGGGQGGGGRGGAPYTPAKDAKDLRAVLFNWMWHQGILRGADERDMVATLEYQAGAGTIQVD